MKITLRTFLLLPLALWVGAEFFFPFVAATVFSILRPDTHTAGRIVGHLLGEMHMLGLTAAVIFLAAAGLALRKELFLAHHTALMMGLVLLMAALTLHSQFTITPAMERNRIAAGGSVDAAPPTDPVRIDFELLHRRSERVEGLIILSGLAALMVLARAESVRPE